MDQVGNYKKSLSAVFGSYILIQKTKKCERVILGTLKPKLGNQIGEKSTYHYF